MKNQTVIYFVVLAVLCGCGSNSVGPENRGPLPAIKAVSEVTPENAARWGEVIQFELPDGEATLTLDFFEHDYELILFSKQWHERDTLKSYAYTVSDPLSLGKLASVQRSPSVGEPLDVIEDHHLHRLGKIQPSQAETKSFESIWLGDGGRTPGTRSGSVILSSDRMLIYWDYDHLPPPDAAEMREIEDAVEAFDSRVYDMIMQKFGGYEDPDGDGKIDVLFTERVAGSRGSAFAQLNEFMVVFPWIGRDLVQTFAHEFHHMVNNHHHLIVHRGEHEHFWLNEALAQVAGDMSKGRAEGREVFSIGYLDDPTRGRLTGRGLYRSWGTRGAAALFLWSLIEDFGEDILARLTQTGLISTENVEAATGEKFDDLVRVFLARAFMNENGLQEAFNYRHMNNYFWTMPGYRMLRMPFEQFYFLGSNPISGTVEPSAAVFIRVVGDGLAQRVVIQTDVEGSFSGLLIPLIKGFRARPVIENF